MVSWTELKGQPKCRSGRSCSGHVGEVCFIEELFTVTLLGFLSLLHQAHKAQPLGLHATVIADNTPAVVIA